MNSPAAPKPGTPPFDTIVAQSGHVLYEQRRTAFHALQMGVDPEDILSYVRGHRPDEFDAVLTHSPWALNKVAALVMAQRRPGSLGARILASTGHTDPYVWGIRDTGDRDRDLASLLDQVN